jgi:tetrathionate reductase subunit B
MNITRRQLLILLPAAAVAWEHLLAGTPESSPNYNVSEHWWGMLVDIEKCIGCGSCVRACQKENNVPDGYYRTWVERYRVSEDRGVENPRVDSPDGGKNGFPPSNEPGVKEFFVPKMCNHCADSPCTQVCPVGATFISPDGVVLVDEKYCLGCRYCVQACPYGCRFIHPEKKTAQKCTLCYHRITKGLTTACCEACPTGARQLADLKNPKDPIHEFLKTHSVQVLKPHLATGAKLFYNHLDGSVR